MPELQNAAIDKLDKVSNEFAMLPEKACRWVFQNTAKGSPLRAWFVFEFVFNYDSCHKDSKCFPHEMLIEMLVRFNKFHAARDLIKLGKRYKNMDDFKVPEN